MQWHLLLNFYTKFSTEHLCHCQPILKILSSLCSCDMKLHIQGPKGKQHSILPISDLQLTLRGQTHRHHLDLTKENTLRTSHCNYCMSRNYLNNQVSLQSTCNILNHQVGRVYSKMAGYILRWQDSSGLNSDRDLFCFGSAASTSVNTIGNTLLDHISPALNLARCHACWVSSWGWKFWEPLVVLIL